MADITTPLSENQLRREVSDRFDRDFNFISLPLLEKAYPDGLFEHIIYPDDYDFENDNEEQPYPMWATLFEARDQILSEMLEKKVKELADIGIHLMKVDETNVMMFIASAGYSFHDAHWIPLYRDVLKWVK